MRGWHIRDKLTLPALVLFQEKLNLLLHPLTACLLLRVCAHIYIYVCVCVCLQNVPGHGNSDWASPPDCLHVLRGVGIPPHAERPQVLPWGAQPHPATAAAGSARHRPQRLQENPGQCCDPPQKGPPLFFFLLSLHYTQSLWGGGGGGLLGEKASVHVLQSVFSDCWVQNFSSSKTYNLKGEIYWMITQKRFNQCNSIFYIIPAVVDQSFLGLQLEGVALVWADCENRTT